MRNTDVLVVGGSAGGLVAAITARRHYPDAAITLVRREQQVLIPCGIPYIFGTVGSPDKNLIPDALLSKNGIDLIVDELTAVDPEAKNVSTAGGETISYDRMVVATGATPVVPPIRGIDLENVFFAKKDVDYIRGMLASLESARKVVVIGGGFIGLEFADECRKRGAEVTVVEMLPHCLALVFDEEMCVRVEEELSRVGVRVLTGTRAESFVGDGRVRGVVLEGGEELEADMVVIGIGVRPDTTVAEKAGLRIGEGGGIHVDRYMRTSDENIFAVGDCADKVDALTGKPSAVRLASIATTEARVAGANLFEARRKNRGALGAFSTKIGEVAAGMAGLSQSRARQEGMDYVVGKAETVNRHPGGMPGAAPLSTALIFHRWSGRLIGGQACGGESVGEIVNVIASMILNGVTADEVATFQMGTHPALTASPIAYPLVNAAELALKEMR